MESDNIIDKAVKYIETRFGETPIERNDKAMEAMQTIRRDKDEDMTEFIQRFEGVMEQLKVVRFELDERLEAALLHRASNLTKPEANNVSSQVDMASTEPGILLKLKAALRKVGFKKEGGAEAKNEAVLQAKLFDDNEPEDATEEAYYGYQGNSRNQRGRNQNQGQNFQGQSFQGQNFQGQYFQGQTNQDQRNRGRQWNNNQQAFNNQSGFRQRQGNQQQVQVYNPRQQNHR